MASASPSAQSPKLSSSSLGPRPSSRDSNKSQRPRSSRNSRHPIYPTQPPYPLLSQAPPRTMALGSTPAALNIDFIIVGAGIAGLATGFALAQSGHRVRILEKLSSPNQPSVGIRVPPNLSKILYEWGLYDDLKKASQCLKSTFLDMESNQPKGVLEWHGDVIKETGGDFLLMHYDDLYRLLLRLAEEKGVAIEYGTEIKGVFYDEAKELPTVELTNGQTYTADIVIGADGYNSIVRSVVTDAPDAPSDTGMSFFSIVVPAEKIKNDPDWSKWLTASEWPIWMAEGRNLLAYPIRNGAEFVVHAYYPDTLAPSVADKSESWTHLVPTSAIGHGQAHPSIPRIFSTVPEALHCKYHLREIVDDWVDESGTIMLLGEAAHPLMPCTIHNLALAVEDAAVLGVLMSHLSERRQIPQFLEAFQDLRFSRVQQVHQSELSNAALTVLGPGPHRDGRDAAFAASLAVNRVWDDDAMAAQWEEISFAFGYNALEAAEEWWLGWGSIGEVNRAKPMFLCQVDVQAAS